MVDEMMPYITDPFLVGPIFLAVIGIALFIGAALRARKVWPSWLAFFLVVGGAWCLSVSAGIEIIRRFFI
jgi:hypothetical protein